MKKEMKEVFSKLMLNILKNYMNLTKIYHFNQKESKLENSKSELIIYIIKLIYIN